MVINKSEAELKQEECVPSWQIFTGCDATWMILRQRMHLGHAEISEIGKLSLLRNTFAVAEDQEGKSLYKGELVLKAYYKIKGQSNEADFSCPDRIDDEHKARELIFSSSRCLMPPNDTTEETAKESVFPGKIYEDLSQHLLVDSPGYSEWTIELPWLSWLAGGEIVGEPRIVLANFAQIGLGTLLCEVVVKLTAGDKLFTSQIANENALFALHEHMTLNLRGGKIERIIGCIITRGLYQLRAERLNRFELSYLLRAEIIYLGTNSGGERVYSASALLEQRYLLPIKESQSKPLFIADIKQGQVELLRYFDRQIVLKNNILITVAENICQDRTHEAALAASLPLEGQEPVKKIPGDCIIRKRPCEKWLKKPGRSKMNSFSQQKVMAIKFGN